MNRKNWLGVAAIAAMTMGMTMAAEAQQGPGPGPGGGPGMGHGDHRGAPPPGMMGDGPGPMMGMQGPRMLERMAGELGLSDDQKQKIQGIFAASRPEMDQARDLARQNAAKLRATKPDDRNYDAVVSEVARSAGDLASRAVTQRAKVRAQIWAVLTPEQRTKMETIQSERRERMKRRMEERRDRMGPPPPPPAAPQK